MVACAMGCSFCQCGTSITAPNGDVLETNPAGTVGGASATSACVSSSGYKSNTNACFNYCKTFAWSENGLCKDVIEPDKACIFGCVNSLCQGQGMGVGCSQAAGEKCCGTGQVTDCSSGACCNGNDNGASASYQKTNSCVADTPGLQSPTMTYGNPERCSACCPKCGTGGYNSCGCQGTS